MQLTTTVFQKLSLASLLTLGTLATFPTVVRSAPIPTPDQFPYITPKDEAGMMPTYTTSTSEPITSGQQANGRDNMGNTMSRDKMGNTMSRDNMGNKTIPQPITNGQETNGKDTMGRDNMGNTMGRDTRGNNTIVDVAVANGSFKTLTAALNAAGLAETLKGNGPFTVFAPTDAAFAKLPAGTVEMLLKPENKATLVRVLTYHVVSGNVLSTDLKSGQVNTVAGSPVNVMISRDGVMVNQSTVKAADVKASNGVIHVIDTVLMPPSN